MLKLSTIPIILLSNDKPLTSFIISAPASTACLATDAFVVSIEINIVGLSVRIFSITGITLFNSSDSETCSAPGRVDSPPISIISAPCVMSLDA